MAAVQRIRQGVRALLAFTHAVDYDLAESYLSPAQMALFRRMQRSEQLHSLNVLRSVLKQGETPQDLAVAALLHDCGKSRYPIAIWQKTLVVLVRAANPKLYWRWSDGDPNKPWQRAFVVVEHHPAWSGELAAEAGVTGRALWLIATHAAWPDEVRDHPYFDLLRRLQEADNLN